ncbi:MAG: SDR family oxidoreductase [Flavobacteriales bacterium]|nr:SDR family oxidoreductase [Flavobacteriales bacterium]
MDQQTKDSVTMNYLVTGANGALGRALAIQLHSAGHYVIATSRSAMKEEWPTSDRLVFIPNVDLMDRNSLADLTKRCEEFFSGPFHVINAVGRFFRHGHVPLLGVDIAEAQEIMASNFLSVQNTATYVLPLQIQRGGGHFIGFSCTSVKYRYPRMGAFSAAKSALETFMGCLANEHYEHRIMSNVFQLSTIDTPYERNLKPDGDFAHWLEPNEIAQQVMQFTQLPTMSSGNTIHLYKHSPTFFGRSFYDRISVK